MKNLLTIICLFVTVGIYAYQPQQSLSRKQRAAIKKAEELDVLKYLPDTTSHNQMIFWNSIVENNPSFNEIMAKFKKPGKLAKDALQKVENNSMLTSIMNMDYNIEKEGKFNDLIHEILFGDKTEHPDIIFRLRMDNDFNAFTTPEGYIYMNNAVIDRTSETAMVYGIFAHEVAHYLYNHMLVHEYKALKREQSNNLAATIAVVGTGVANMAVVSKGGIVDSRAMQNSYNGIVDGAKEWSTAYYYRYGREQELEADIVAYRFLEWIGEDPNFYIKTLEISNTGWAGKETECYDDHPSAEERIAVLKSLKPAPYSLYK